MTKKNDFLIDTLEHSWGKSPKQKAREKEYNAEYYQKHKEKWANKRHAIGEGQNAYNSAYYTGKSMAEIRGDVTPSIAVKRARALEAAARNERDKAYWNAFKQEEYYGDKYRQASYKEAVQRLFKDAPYMLKTGVNDLAKKGSKAAKKVVKDGNDFVNSLKKETTKTN